MFNIFISIVINVMFLLFDLITFSWLHISQINTEMFSVFFKIYGIYFIKSQTRSRN